MARKHRVREEGAIYHVMNRGDRRKTLFRDDQDRTLFLATLGACGDRTGWEVHALCLMPNHLHLVVETPQPNLAAAMSAKAFRLRVGPSYQHTAKAGQPRDGVS